MRRVYYLLFMVVICLFMTGMAIAQFHLQDFPLNIQKAYDNGTRSMDGVPGPEYWLNHSEYDIKVTLVPSKLLLKGSAEINYQNNSPDSLNKIVVRLFPNLYKKGASRDYNLNESDIHDGVIISFLSIDGEEVDVDLDPSAMMISGTNSEIILDSPLAPGDDVDIAIDWRYRIPRKEPGRTGAYSDSAFFIAYWYPQIAVYDDIDGWEKN